MELSAKYRANLQRLLPDQAMLRALVTRHAAAAPAVLREIADPRGRCNRQAFLHIAIVFLALQTIVSVALWLVGFEMSQSAAILFNAPILWIGTAVCVKRLHDVGRRGWWIPGSFALWFTGAMLVSVVASLVLGPDALDAGKPAFIAVFAMITLPAFGALLWLHTAPSVQGANTFGPMPGASGLSMPHSTATSVAHVFSGSVLA